MTHANAGKLEHEGVGEDVEKWANLVIGAAIEVHRVLGPWFLESVYEEALCLELQDRGIPFERQFAFGVNYKGQCVGQGRIDILVGGCLVIELKAVDKVAEVHMAQALSYLKAIGLRLALLVNFKVPVLKSGIKRVVL